ncbi:MAG: discoidin domain-containing protein [Planctomycetia bacterium]|nr:discoidin domain-containing protein [Planctomycetia bacterium]
MKTFFTKLSLTVSAFLLCYPLCYPLVCLQAGDSKEMYIVTDPPVVQAECQGEPIVRFGYCEVWQQAPDLQEDVTLQLGNEAAREKVRPKKSSELKSNYLGTNTSGMPRSRLTDYQPLEVVHLIDGDAQTCWLGRGVHRPEMDPLWLRLELPFEQTINRIVLKKREIQYNRLDYTRLPAGGAVEVGRALPKNVRLEGTRDGYTWFTLWDGATGDTPEKSEFVATFEPVAVQSLRMIATETVRVENNFGYSCSFSELEVYNTKNQNIALISRGTGIVGSSTERGRNEIDLLRSLWAIHNESGFKWVRIGYHDDPINWHEVERKKGVLEVDPVTDAAITEFANQGLDIIMCLNFGNRLYTDQAKSMDASGHETVLTENVNRNRPLPQLWEWYYDSPNPPVTEEALAAWDRYVEFMATKYKDRVRYFEVWNEWNISLYWGDTPNLEHYLTLARRAIAIIRRCAPNVKILAGSTAGFPDGCRDWTPEVWADREQNDYKIRSWKELMPLVDAVGYHPYYHPDPQVFFHYADDVRALKRWAQAQGFSGMFMATEWNISMRYPAYRPEDAGYNLRGNDVSSEMQKAKYTAQCFVQDSALGLASCFCEMNQPFYNELDLSLLRRSADSEPTSILHPQAAFYMARNLATMLDEFTPLEFSVDVDAESLENLRTFTFKTPTGCAVAIWRGGLAKDVTERTPVSLTVPYPAKSATALDPLNGVAQNLIFETRDNRTTTQNVMVSDCPLIIQFIE